LPQDFSAQDFSAQDFSAQSRARTLELAVRLHVNIDHVATLRNQRDASYPDPVEAALLCERAGADGITAHLREDRRHIRDADVGELRRRLTTLLNLECAATREMAEIAANVRPHVVTLVPEKREERTTEGGLDVERSRPAIQQFCDLSREHGIKLSLFIEPDTESVKLAHELRVQQVEFHTGRYCHLEGSERDRECQRIANAAKLAAEHGLEVAAGHGLTCANVGAIAAIPEIAELNIGHSVVSDAVMTGMEEAVRQLRQAITRGTADRARLA
jgi:pyridoxine 5-phosphate synthase